MIRVDREGPVTIVNPEIVESRGEWVYDEGAQRYIRAAKRP